MSKIKLPRFFFILVFISTLSGCTTPVTPDFAEMSKKYAILLEQYQINNLFMNIIRSYEGHPLSFLDMPNIIGSGSVSHSASVNGTISSASIGSALAGLTSLNPSLGLSFGNSFNFTQSSLDNAIFWKSFMEPIPAESIDYFKNNHIPKEVLMTLLIDQIIITQTNGSKQAFINNPLKPNYAEFQRIVYELINDGFTTESVIQEIEEGAPLTEAELKREYGQNPRLKLSLRNMGLKTIQSKPTNLYQVTKLIPVYMHCMNSDRYANFDRVGQNTQTYCAPLQNQGNEISSSTTDKPKLRIVIRSVKNIYDFLGQTMKAQLKNTNPYLITLPPSAQTIPDKEDEMNSYALFVVLKNPVGVKTHSAIDALDGNTYAVPFTNNGYTPLVMNILSQFQTLAKNPSAIPSSPAVLIK